VRFSRTRTTSRPWPSRHRAAAALLAGDLGVIQRTGRQRLCGAVGRIAGRLARAPRQQHPALGWSRCRGRHGARRAHRQLPHRACPGGVPRDDPGPPAGGGSCVLEWIRARRAASFSERDLHQALRGTAAVQARRVPWVAARQRWSAHAVLRPGRRTRCGDGDGRPPSTTYPAVLGGTSAPRRGRPAPPPRPDFWRGLLRMSSILKNHRPEGNSEDFGF